VTENPTAGSSIKVNGASFEQMPPDLYIPPDALEVFLDRFEGPLDLLLYLIRRENIDILDIPVAEITRQYMSYIDMMQTMSLELAAEYLLMAAILAEIKSRMLLPRVVKPGEANEEDPRAELVRRLQEYEQFRQAAHAIELLPRMDREHHLLHIDTSSIPSRKIPPEIALDAVLDAMKGVMQRLERLKHHRIFQEPLSVRERMVEILQKLGAGRSLNYRTLFSAGEGRRGAVVALLAILELCRDAMINIDIDEAEGQILVSPRRQTE
jgi:segregation and condensation protein A